MRRLIIVLAVVLTLGLPLAGPVAAHPGNTASDGCHYCRTNCGSWGVPWDQRHCHGASGGSGGGGGIDLSPLLDDPPSRPPPDPPDTWDRIGAFVDDNWFWLALGGYMLYAVIKDRQASRRS